jgi:hypothetical protein
VTEQQQQQDTGAPAGDASNNPQPAADANNSAPVQPVHLQQQQQDSGDAAPAAADGANGDQQAAATGTAAPSDAPNSSPQAAAVLPADAANEHNAPAADGGNATSSVPPGGRVASGDVAPSPPPAGSIYSLGLGGYWYVANVSDVPLGMPVKAPPGPPPTSWVMAAWQVSNFSSPAMLNDGAMSQVQRM